MSEEPEVVIYDEDDDCWQCGGEGGYPQCMEDTCPALYGEENCTDEACWRTCDICRGKGHLRSRS